MPCVLIRLIVARNSYLSVCAALGNGICNEGAIAIAEALKAMPAAANVSLGGGHCAAAGGGDRTSERVSAVVLCV